MWKIWNARTPGCEVSEHKAAQKAPQHEAEKNVCPSMSHKMTAVASAITTNEIQIPILSNSPAPQPTGHSDTFQNLALISVIYDIYCDICPQSRLRRDERLVSANTQDIVRLRKKLEDHLEEVRAIVACKPPPLADIPLAAPSPDFPSGNSLAPILRSVSGVALQPKPRSNTGHKGFITHHPFHWAHRSKYSFE